MNVFTKCMAIHPIVDIFIALHRIGKVSQLLHLLAISSSNQGCCGRLNIKDRKNLTKHLYTKSYTWFLHISAIFALKREMTKVEWQSTNEKAKKPMPASHFKRDERSRDWIREWVGHFILHFFTSLRARMKAMHHGPTYWYLRECRLTEKYCIISHICHRPSP